MNQTARGERRSKATCLLPRSAAARRNRVFAAIGIFVASVALAGATLPDGMKIAARFEPAATAPGSIVELALTVELPPGWVAFDLEQEAESAFPARISLLEHRELAPLETFVAPPALEKRDPQFTDKIVRYFDRSPTFHRKILVGHNAQNGWLRLEGRLDIQVRNQATGKSLLLLGQSFSATLQVGTQDASNSFSKPGSTPNLPADLPRQVPDVQLPLTSPTKPVSPKFEPPISTPQNSQNSPSNSLVATPIASSAASKAAGLPTSPAAGERTVSPAPAPTTVPETKTPDPPVNGQWLYDDPSLSKPPFQKSYVADPSVSDHRSSKPPGFGKGFDGPSFQSEALQTGDWRLTGISGILDGGWLVIPTLFLGLLFACSLKRMPLPTKRKLVVAGFVAFVGIAGAFATRLPHEIALPTVTSILAFLGIRIVIDGRMLAAIPSDREGEVASARDVLLTPTGMRAAMAVVAVVAGLTVVSGQRYSGPASAIGMAFGIFLGTMFGSIFGSKFGRGQIRGEPIFVDEVDGEPQIPPLFFGLAMLGVAVDAAAQWDLIDGSYAWLGFYHVVAGWGVFAAAGVLRLVLPWPTATRSLYRQPLRLIALMGLAWFALLCLAAMSDEPRFDGIFAHLEPGQYHSQTADR